MKHTPAAAHTTALHYTTLHYAAPHRTTPHCTTHIRYITPHAHYYAALHVQIKDRAAELALGSTLTMLKSKGHNRVRSRIRTKLLTCLNQYYRRELDIALVIIM
jgi:hypothetical protein